MTNYQLRVHSCDVAADYGQHTGYDLITTHEDGSQTIQYIQA